MKTSFITRRSFVASGVAAPLASAIAIAMATTLAACGDKAPKVPAFNGIDLTGAKYGKQLDLVDHNGKRRSLSDFKGKVVMLFFGFTQCPDVCPTALARAAEIKGQLAGEGDKLQILFVTIDPDRDTAPVLKAYMAAFDPTFLGLIGNAEETKRTADEFKVYYRQVPTGSSYTMDHSAITYVFDPSGQMRLAFRHEDSAKNCANDIRNLLKTS